MKKTVLGINIFEVKAIDNYWSRLEKDLDVLLNHLQTKYEYGSTELCSEAGIQKCLVNCADRIAEKAGFNRNKAKCICMAAGLCFPKFGSYGIAACKQYMAKNNISYDFKELQIGAIEYAIYNNGSIVTPQLDEALHAYYDNRKDIPEVNIARYCQIKAMESRELMKNGMFAGKALSNIIDCAENKYSTEDSIVKTDTLCVDIPKIVQKTIDEDLAEYIYWHGLLNGIFEFLT